MFELFLQNRAAIQKLLVLLLFLLALWRGRGPERACSGVLLVMVLVHLFIRDVLDIPSIYASLDPLDFLIDFGGLAALGAIALKANRFYPLAMAAAQLVSFLAHLVRMLVEPVSTIAYYLLSAMPFWFIIFILAGGIAHHIYRGAHLGAYSDWRIVPSRSHKTGYA